MHKQLKWAILLGLATSACSDSAPQPAKITDITGFYSGTGLEGVAPHSVPIGMEIRPDGTFIGKTPVADGFAMWAGHWSLAGLDKVRQCTKVDFIERGRVIWTYCLSVERDNGRGPNFTGIDCENDVDDPGLRVCLMRRVQPADANLS
jgi:hypothetical protein